MVIIAYFVSWVWVTKIFFEMENIGVDSNLQASKTLQEGFSIHLMGFPYVVDIDYPKEIGPTIMMGCIANQILAYIYINNLYFV